MKLINIWNHFKTITKHRMLVCRHCFQIGLYRQGLTHDLSKYSPEEFFTGVRYYQGTRSPNAAEREDLAIQRPGFTTRAAISIIMNTGSIFLSVRKRD